MKHKKLLALHLALTLIVVAAPLAPQDVFAAAPFASPEMHVKAANAVNAASISVKKKNVQVGKKITLKINNAKQKVKWSVSNKKAMKVVKVSGKKNQKATFLAKKVQKVMVTAKVGKKKVKYSIDITSGKVVLNVLDDVVTNKILYEVVNGTKKKITYGADFNLEIYKNASWVTVPVRKNVVIPTAHYSLKANSKCTESVYIDWLYEELPSGKYRISKTGMKKSNSFTIRDMKEVSVSAEFNAANNKKMTLTVFNGMDQDISINPFHFPLQKLIDGVWVDVAEKESDIVHPTVMQPIKAGKKWSKEIVLDDVYENILSGDYVIEVVGAKRVFFALD
jgi:endoglucanase Acf2